EEATVRSPAKLMDIYFNGVGKGGCLNLGIAPDRDGLICAADQQSLEVFGNSLRTLFAVNLAQDGKAGASNVRAWQAAAGQKHPYAPDNVLDDDRYSYWATDDNVTNATLTVVLPAMAEFNVVRLREDIRLGHRIDGFAVEVLQDGEWREYAKGRSIGACRLLRGPKVKSDRVRLRVTSAAACPCVSDFGLFMMPAMIGQAETVRN
ncbi:MAG: hypothetical protein PHU80_02320, partial [Kiritimatiellae bacterium]|nr:hypothetical protein [Kiritimatiellia bacterium]